MVQEESSLNSSQNVSGDAYLYLMLRVLFRGWKLLLGGMVLAGALGFGVASLLRPVFTAQAVLLPPQQQGGLAGSALGSLGSLVGAGAGIKSPAEQFVAFMQSNRVMDPIIDKFNLMNTYEAKFRADARKALSSASKISLGKKDGLIYIQVDDENPVRASEIANAYIDGLRVVTTTLSVTEGQQRRRFFEQQLQQTKEKLTAAQAALQSSGYSANVVKAEPKAAAEAFARARAELMAAEIRLQSLRRMLSENTPEVIQQAGTVSALRLEMGRLERKDTAKEDIGYISNFREFKYQEALFEMFSKQYEQARLDESRDGALIQVLDVATPPERKSKPKRIYFALLASAIAFFSLSAWIMVRETKGML